MFARLCRQTLNEDPKRRHSWSSEIDYQLVETEVVNISGEDPASSLVSLKNNRISYKEHGRSLQTVDLVADCPLQIVTDSSRSLSFSTLSTFLPSSTFAASATSMGQRSSALSRPKISLTWVLRGQQQSGSNGTYSTTNGNGNANSDRDLLSRGSKERSSRRSLKCFKEKNAADKENIEKSVEKREKKIMHRLEKMERIEETSSKEPISDERRLDSTLEKYFDKEFVGLKDIKEKEKVKRATSEPSLLVSHESMSTSSGRENNKHRRHGRTKRSYKPSRFPISRSGYEIADLDAFLTKASIERPANIPVVLSFPSVLYQTRGGIQDEMALPLGTVVNAIFKNQAWLYVQTPHGQEGYVGYSACLPLGILPHPTRGPCWEDSTDIFPRPLGNMTDTEKLRDTRSECGVSRGRSGRIRRCTTRDALSACGERSVDRLYLRAAANARTKGGSRHTLLVIRSDYEAGSANALTVFKGDVVVLLSDHISDWFWVRSRDGKEGFIPSVVAGHGFL